MSLKLKVVFLKRNAFSLGLLCLQDTRYQPDVYIYNIYKEEEVRITEDFLNKHKTANGSYTRKQLHALGVSWPPEKGWKKKIIGKKLDSEFVHIFVNSKETKYTRKNTSRANKNKQVLIDNNIDYESYNNGTHLKIYSIGLIVDFWPTTDTYIVNIKNGAQIKGKGVLKLINYLKNYNYLYCLHI